MQNVNAKTQQILIDHTFSPFIGDELNMRQKTKQLASTKTTGLDPPENFNRKSIRILSPKFLFNNTLGLRMRGVA